MKIYASSNRLCVLSGFKLVAVCLFLAFCTVTLVPSAWSQENAPAATGGSADGGNPSSAGLQAAAGISNFVYFPLKLIFAIGGGVVGGFTYVFSGGNEEATKSVWTTSFYGTYILTPDHLQGNRPIRFLGVADSNGASNSAR